jgi:ATP-dependent helicase HrpB
MTPSAPSTRWCWRASAPTARRSALVVPHDSVPGVPGGCGTSGTACTLRASPRCIAWTWPATGNTPERFRWFEAPTAERLQAAQELLTRLGAIDGSVVTALGHQLRRLPFHPRLARVLLAADGAWEAAAACALLSEGWATVPKSTSPAPAATTCDLLPLIDRWTHVTPHTRQVAEAVHRLGREVLGGVARDHVGEAQLRRALLAGYPDRVARRRPQDPSRVVLASGRGALIGRECAVAEGEWLVALDLTNGRPGQSEALVRSASRVEAAWLVPTARAIEHRLDEDQGSIKAFAVSRYGAIVMSEQSVAPDPAERVRLLAARWRERPLNEPSQQLLRRARFAGLDLDLVALSETAAATARSVQDLDILAALPWDTSRALERAAPVSLPVPSGRSARLDYREDGTVSAAVKLQELFGLAETPVLGPRRQPVVIELLAPNGRPVQTTTDLCSFWERTYPDVRRELRGRYPKHPWPEDPWTAVPTHRTVRRS